MNQDNNTIVSAGMLRKLKEAGLDRPYKEIPGQFEQKVKELLGNAQIVDIDEETKTELRDGIQEEQAFKAQIERLKSDELQRFTRLK